jgi:hypothetical protein
LLRCAEGIDILQSYRARGLLQHTTNAIAENEQIQTAIAMVIEESP